MLSTSSAVLFSSEAVINFHLKWQSSYNLLIYCETLVHERNLIPSQKVKVNSACQLSLKAASTDVNKFWADFRQQGEHNPCSMQEKGSIVGVL